MRTRRVVSAYAASILIQEAINTARYLADSREESDLRLLGARLEEQLTVLRHFIADVASKEGSP